MKISFGAGKYVDSTTLKRKLNFMLGEYGQQYGIQIDEDEIFSVRLSRLILRIHEATKNQVVFLIDEYDKPVLDAIYSDFENENRVILQDLYSPLKDYDEYIKFVFITGITKIDHVNIFSGLNQLNDISMDDEYAAFCGLTEEEIKKNFAPELETLAKNEELSDEETFAKLKLMYDGYKFTNRTKEGIYNPFSVLKCFSQKKFGSYWFESATPTFRQSSKKRNAKITTKA